MSPLIIALVGVSAVLHVAWNVRLKTAGDPLRTAAIGLLAASLVIGPLGLAAWWLGGRPALPPEGIALGLLSGVVEAAYFVFLAAAYRRGDLSVVYPIARGTAPLLAVALGVFVLGERLGVPGWIGVGCLLAGFVILQRPWRAIALARGGAAGRGALRDSAVLFALACGVAIATYSAIDRVGTQLIDPITYAAVLFLSGTILLLAWIAIAAGGDLRRDGPEATRRAAVGGFLTLAAYLCILVALSVAPLSGVAPLRESATVLAAAWGSLRLGEASDSTEATRRIGASVLIVGGALLLAVGG